MPADGNKTRERIIKDAIILFKEKGYQNVSVQDICEKADIKRASFYYHFKTKDAILDSFYDDIEMPDVYNAKMITTDNCWMKLWLMTLPSIQWTVGMGSELLSTIFMLNFQNGRQTFFPIREESEKQLILEVIRKAQGNGQFKNTKDALYLYHNYRNVIIGIAAVWCMKKGSFDEETEILQTLITLFQPEPELVSETTEWLEQVGRADQ